MGLPIDLLRQLPTARALKDIAERHGFRSCGDHAYGVVLVWEFKGDWDKINAHLAQQPQTRSVKKMQKFMNRDRAYFDALLAEIWHRFYELLASFPALEAEYKRLHPP